MAHCLIRLYTEAQPNPGRLERFRTEMLPKLRAISGFQRLATLQTQDGRYGAFQVYDTAEEVEHASSLLRGWRDAMGYHDPISIDGRGEIGLSIVVNPTYDRAWGVIRIYRTEAAFAQVCAVIEREGVETIRGVPGVLRYTVAQLDGGRIGAFSACESEAAARNLTETARNLRNKAGSQLGKVLPQDPEVITGEITLTARKTST
ncbi:MAG: hypothetical protein NVSMB18_20930 [Acetobacteraceae bacterium]